jgi:hypothetical protein
LEIFEQTFLNNLFSLLEIFKVLLSSFSDETEISQRHMDFLIIVTREQAGPPKILVRSLQGKVLIYKRLERLLEAIQLIFNVERGLFPTVKASVGEADCLPIYNPTLRMNGAVLPLFSWVHGMIEVD